MQFGLQGIKSIVVGLYTPHGEKAKFFEHLFQQQLSFSYQHWYILGDWNGVVTLQLDRSIDKVIKAMQGKLPVVDCPQFALVL